MGEVLANLYGVTGKREYLELAQRFDKKGFFDPLRGAPRRTQGVTRQYACSASDRGFPVVRAHGRPALL